VAGVQKLIQRYVISLMNSGFPEAIIGANATNIQNASHLFNLYNWEVIAQFRDYQKITSGLPTDEQLQTVQLDSATIAVADNSNGYPGGMVRFRATLSTVAGNAVPFVLPLSIL
jgi:hypothetical protein